MTHPRNHGLCAHIADDAAHALIGLAEPAPLKPLQLAAALRVSFYPRAEATPRVRAFAERLHAALLRWGVAVLPHAEARTRGAGARLVVITAGEATTGDLALDHVANLRTTTLVTILDGPCPADRETGLQARLDAVVRSLAWHGAQTTLFVEDDRWTFCTMNGAIVRFSSMADFDLQVLAVLVPKLAAPVVPPHAADFDVRHGALDVGAPGLARAAADFGASASAWARTGLLLFHTPVASLEFRNRFYQRVTAAYLDHRSGMSYGFLARQLPTPVEPAMDLAEADRLLGAWDWDAAPLRAVDGRRHVRVDVAGARLVVPVPDVRVLTTRSGCDKSRLDPRRDLVVLALSGGRFVLETPPDAATDSKPSYDTRTILANAVANAVAASVLARLSPTSTWAERVVTEGVGQAHWHGTMDADGLPEGYVVHGAENPPVSCSTAQSALFALAGKLVALHATTARGVDLAGDVHVEPFHGVNVTGASLSTLADLVLEQQRRDNVARFNVQEAPPPRPADYASPLSR